MPEIHLPCQFGAAKRKQRADGNWTKGRPPSCTNPASGVWKVTLRQGRGFTVKIMLLCADCGFRRMSARVRCFETDDGLIFYKDVESIELVQSFTTKYDPTLDWVPPGAVKHWVEGPDKPATPSRRKIKNSIPAAYLESLRKHDDGK